MTHQVKALTIRSEDLSLNPRNQHGRREFLEICPLTSTCVPKHPPDHTLTYNLTHIHKNDNK